MKKQKEAVIWYVENILGSNFVSRQTNVINTLSDANLEDLKQRITNDIGLGLIEYSKDRTNYAEVRTYARSMVMNHLKKAKELNGNQEPSGMPNGAAPRQAKPKKDDLVNLPEYLQTYVDTTLNHE